MTGVDLAVRGILRQAMPPVRRFLPGLVSGVLSAGAAISLLLVSGWLIVSASIVDSLVPLSVAVVGVRFFAISRAVFRYLERLAGHDAALRQLAGLRAGIVRRLTPLSPAGLGGTDRGSVLSALVDDVENLQNLPLRVVQPLVTGGIVAVGSVAVMALVSPAAAVVLATCLLLAVGAAVLIGWMLGDRAERAVSQRRADLSGALVDYLTALDVLLAFGVEQEARERIRSADAALRRSVTRAALAQAASVAVVSVAAGAASIWALAVAAPGVSGGAADAPWFAVAVLLPMAVFEVFAVVPQAASSWRSVRSSAQRIAAVVPETVPAEVRLDDGPGRVGDPGFVQTGGQGHPRGTPPADSAFRTSDAPHGALRADSGHAAHSGDDPGRGGASAARVDPTGREASGDPGGSRRAETYRTVADPDALEPPTDADPGGEAARASDARRVEDGRSTGRSDKPDSARGLRLTGIRAAWPGASEPALRGVDLEAKPGERVLVTGPSGAGKSTLAAVLAGFLRFDGDYLIDGEDAGGIHGTELRRWVGLCEQTPQLFDEDIRQNLLFARDTATDDELLAVLDRVGLGDWVRERGGLDARVGERGALVSGGQAQRISLARALLRGFPVLVLDEPTAGVDADASDVLLRDLLGAADDQTVILISHVAPPEGTVDRRVRIVRGRSA